MNTIISRSLVRRPAAELLRRVVRALAPTRGNALFTLLIVGSLILAGRAGALPMVMPARMATSTSAIPYQGRLTSASGAPLSGTYDVTFRLYDVASGGSPLWSESWTGSGAVQVTDGLLSVLLGSLTPIPQSVVANHSSLWLGVTVGADSEMTPRVQLGTVPYAVQALSVPDGSITAAKLAADVSLDADGWSAADETWGYLTARTFSAPGDMTSRYGLGTKIKLSQGGTTRYFYVTGTSYSAPTTTVTLTGGDDYVLASGPITGCQYSYANPPDFPEWLNYHPTYGASPGMSFTEGVTVISKFAMSAARSSSSSGWRARRGARPGRTSASRSQWITFRMLLRRSAPGVGCTTAATSPGSPSSRARA